jgi:tRNA dimethylallyltransferase
MLYVVAGPTASGKTAVAVALAKRIGGEVVNADSMQVYKGMDIGTAKPTPTEQDGIPHHLLDVVFPDEPFSAARYQELTLAVIKDIQTRGCVPILTGGTGFYINAVVYDTDFSSQTEDDTDLRDCFIALAVEKGAYHLHGLLQERDPKAAEAIHPRNTKRIARALAFVESTGSLFSAHNIIQKEKKAKPTLPEGVKFFVLDLPRNILYDRINQRVEKMYEAGLEREVTGLLQAGYSPNLPAMSGIGYKETSMEEVKQNTRRYAKRQLTWFRHNAPHAIWLNAENKSAEQLAIQIINTKE